MSYAPDYLDNLANELLRATSRGEKFTTLQGEIIEGATESDTIKHLTSGRDYYPGRQYRFPGIGSGWEFESAIEAAGFRIIKARNYRNQICRVVTL